MVDLAVKNATAIAPWGRVSGTLLVSGGQVEGFVRRAPRARRTIDADGLWLMPGMVDGHVHFMDPGAPEREDFISGSSAAAAGGVTTVLEHTHARPIRDATALAEKAQYLADRSLIDYGLIAHLWPDDQTAIAPLREAGASAFKAFTCSTHGIPGIAPGRLRSLLSEVARVDGICLVHCEEESLTAEAEAELRAAGRTDGGVVPLWRNRAAETVAAEAVAFLARITGTRIVIAHASQPSTVEAALRQRRRGAKIAVETCPQYLYLREEESAELGPLRKFTPPARSAEESDRLWSHLADGHITQVQSDHAPSTLAQKHSADIWDCPFGLPGVETTLSMLLEAVSRNRLTAEQVVALYSEGPARTYGLYPRKGSLIPGADADFVLVDPTAERELDNAGIISRAGWTPYAGLRLRGRPVMTVSRGVPVACDGRPVAGPGHGRFTRP